MSLESTSDMVNIDLRTIDSVVVDLIKSRSTDELDEFSAELKTRHYESVLCPNRLSVANDSLCEHCGYVHSGVVVTSHSDLLHYISLMPRPSVDTQVGLLIKVPWESWITRHPTTRLVYEEVVPLMAETMRLMWPVMTVGEWLVIRGVMMDYCASQAPRIATCMSVVLATEFDNVYKTIVFASKNGWSLSAAEYSNSVGEPLPNCKQDSLQGLMWLGKRGIPLHEELVYKGEPL